MSALREHYNTRGTQNIVWELVSALKQCGKRRDLEGGKALHLLAVESGRYTDRYVGNALVTMYSKCGSMGCAQDVFDKMFNRDVVSWNTLIMGYVEQGQCTTALHLFERMHCEPNVVTYVAALKACIVLAQSDRYLTPQQQQEYGEFLMLSLEKGMSIHRAVKERGFDRDLFVATNLVDMYIKCRSMNQARRVFDEMPEHNVVSWNILIQGYVENGESSLALETFSRMNCEPDPVTFVAALKACTSLASENPSDRQFYLEKGITIHNQAKGCIDIFVENNLVDMYSKCGNTRLSRSVFDNMVHRNVVSWTSLIQGYVEAGESLLALELFMNMQCEPNSLTYVAVLKACGNSVELTFGRGTHIQVCKAGLEQDQFITTMLVDFYGKCGGMNTAQKVFDDMQHWNSVSWNALMSGYGALGETPQVFSLVRGMQEGGLEMNSVTFLLVLTACSRAGMVEQGRKYFNYMSAYGVTPTMEHYTCMVDMLGRCNRLQEALDTARGMPSEPDCVVWTTLLASCRDLNNVEVGKTAFDALVKCSKKDAASYVLIREMYNKLCKQEELEVKPKECNCMCV